MKTVGIIGYGFVGKAVGQMAVKDAIRVIPFDIYNETYSSPAQMLAAFSADFVFACVPTPTDPEDGRLDVSIVVDCVKKWKDVSQNINSVLVIKSTIPVGTVDELCDLFETDRIVHNPEFLTERTAMQDFLEVDEIVVGGPNPAACELVIDLYNTWIHAIRPGSQPGDIKVVSTDARTAEMVKMVRNSFYAAKVAFMNQIYDLCVSMDIDYGKFRDIFAREGKHAWVNPMHTYVPGPRGAEYDELGNITNEHNRFFAGKCLPKDSLGLVSLADSYDVDMTILKEAILANDKKREASGQETR